MYNLYSIWLVCYWLSWFINACCNRGQQHLAVCQPTKPLTSRLPVCQNLLVQVGDSIFKKRDIQQWLEQCRKFEKCNWQHIRPMHGKRCAVLSRWVSVLRSRERVKEECQCGSAQCGASGRVRLWSIVFKTSVSAVSNSRQPN